MRRLRGFTLLELLVALFICAIVFSMGYGAINQALGHREQVEKQAARLLAVQQAMRWLEQDFALLQPRPVRDPLGNGWLAPLVYNANSLAGMGGAARAGERQTALVLQSALVGFTRGGWANPAGVPRSELQRAGYVLRDRKLVRQYLPVLDAGSAVNLQEQVLLDDVDAFSLRFMDASLTWSASWPTPLVQNGPATELPRMRPVAIEVTLRLADYGTLKRIIEVGG